ncbi:GNAT family N-acetyltransferase, partial [Enterococcus faecium]|nr:GNAT family N-acetyltransferase [Enterococcus faecium]MCZ1334181.1 GNAT family N-acetyltransferase [Enterococcus faecium]MCZ1337253.1 GNAT family N-acetyltransferase [Enterococcus faecium]MCZ1339831.1 GNAT family N-acetyltransferase [Enterococcus faecium]MCZ1348699.1 GNAT family N-acetyltransferase [Enterococcus faecium]
MAALKALIIRKFTTRLPGEFIRMRCCLGPILFLLHLKNILLKQRLILDKVRIIV